MTPACTLRWSISADRHFRSFWRVEAQDVRISDGIVDADGRSYVTVFAGDDAEERATEYFEWKSGEART